MSLAQKLDKSFIITTELGTVKAILTDESLGKASNYLPLGGISVHGCPMGNPRINSVSIWQV